MTFLHAGMSGHVSQRPFQTDNIDFHAHSFIHSESIDWHNSHEIDTNHV